MSGQPSTSTGIPLRPIRTTPSPPIGASKPTRSNNFTKQDDDDDIDSEAVDTPTRRLFDQFDSHGSDNAEEGSKNSWSRNLYLLMEKPTSSTSAFIIHFTSTFLIVLSAFITVLETLPAFHTSPSHVWFGLETSLVVCFTAEYLARLAAHGDSWKSLINWVGSFFAVIDLLAIVPYYIEIAVQADTTTFFRFSILRTFRLLRVFRPFRYSHTILLTIEVMYLSMKRSKDALLALGFFVLMAVIVFSTLLYFAERGIWDETLATFVNSDGDPTQFESIPAAAWFVLVTITTVGYGEIVPRSFLGRLFTLPLLLFGLLLIALPSFVLGREFSTVWETMVANGRINISSGRYRSVSILERMENQETPLSAVDTSPTIQRARRAPAPFGPWASSSSLRNSDLTNRKLAENQQVLSRQIEELVRMVGDLREEVRRTSGRREEESATENAWRTGGSIPE